MRALVAAALVCVVAVVSASTLALAGGIDNCFIVFHNTLSRDSVRLCGRQNGGVPGAWYERALAPGQKYRRPCQSNAGTSLLTYLTFRNDTACGWDNGCPAANGGICKSYPYQLGEGVGSTQYWYGGIGATSGGDPGIAYQNKYTYGVSLSCLSYGVQPWNATCVPDATGDSPICTPNVPANGAPNSGVVACGKQGNIGDIYVMIFG